MKRCMWLIPILSIAFLPAGTYAKQSSTQALIEWRNGRRHFVIITATYNNAAWYDKNIDSTLSQTYSDYSVVITDDASTDRTADLIAQRIEEHKAWDRVTLVRNTKRQGAMKNQETMIRTHCNPTDIVVIADGDDWFIDPEVLTYLAEVYKGPVWLTYGQFIEYPSGTRGFCVDMPDYVVQNNRFRHFCDIPSHLRTFYAGLFFKIDPQDLCERDGRPLRMCADIGAMFPMIEMARNGHFKFIDRPLLIYNAANSLNDYKVSKSLQRTIDLDLRSRRPYKALVHLF